MNTKNKRRQLAIFSILLLIMCVIIGLVFNTDAGISARADSVENYYSQFIFDPINNGEEYSVRAANRSTIITADIPYIYNGKKVTEIANNGFAACTKLTKVSIPKTIKRIGQALR